MNNEGREGKKPGLIISGGQTGADRGGLDAARKLGIPRSGWCPQGRRAEDGRIPSEYALRETKTSSYPERTELNVRWADATVVFTHGPPQGGSALTLELARGHQKPFLHIDLDKLSVAEAVKVLRDWIAAEGVSILNVAGSREGTVRGIREIVERIVTEALTPH